jgi:hypothetical protein
VRRDPAESGELIFRDRQNKVRREFLDLINEIMRQGPLGTDFVLCAVMRMAEEVRRTADDDDSGFACEWIEYARWVSDFVQSRDGVSKA